MIMVVRGADDHLAICVETATDRHSSILIGGSLQASTDCFGAERSTKQSWP
jgi:hypothetical protein